MLLFFKLPKKENNNTSISLKEEYKNQWSQFKELKIVRDNGTVLTSTPENWENTMRYSIGVNYRYSDVVKLRAGLAYDQEAIKDEFRTARIPGNDSMSSNTFFLPSSPS